MRDRATTTILVILMIQIICLNLVGALAPPSEDFVEWENVHQMRRRLNTTFNYHPRHIHPEICRNLSEEKCREEDAIVADHKQNRRHLIPNQGDNLRIPVLLVRFKGHDNRNVPSREYFDELLNGNKIDKDINPVGSLSKWLHYNSVGKYKATFDVQDWMDTNDTEASFSQGNFGFLGPSELQAIFVPVLEQLDNSGFDFSVYDSEGFGVFNHLVVIHSGYGAELGNPPADCDDNEAKDRIWAQGIGGTANPWESKDFYTFDSYLIVGAFTDGMCQYRPAEVGIIAHEYTHGFRMIDLYDQDDNEPGISVGGVGVYDVMSTQYGWRRNQKIPGHLSCFTRAFVGWIEPIEITRDGYYPIQASELSSQCYIITTGFPMYEYLIIENRQPLKFDDWPSGGIIIYHIDDQLIGQETRGFPDHPNWPAEHYRVAVLQADGEYEIETGKSPGDEGDIWIQGMKLAPSDAGGTGKVWSDGRTWPNTDSYQWGDLKKTGIEIEILSPSRFIMSFHISGVEGTTRTNSRVRDGISRDPDTTGSTAKFILSIFGGVAALMGVLVLVL